MQLECRIQHLFTALPAPVLAANGRRLPRRSGLEPLTSTDWRHHEMQRRVTRVAALVDQRLRRLLAHADFDEFFGAPVRFAEVGAETALSIV
jgi:hypothetical protein